METSAPPVTQQPAPALSDRRRAFDEARAGHLLEGEPARFYGSDVVPMLVHATRRGASDIRITTDHPIICDIHGQKFPITRRPLTPHEVEDILNFIYENGPSVIKTGVPLDKSYEIRPKGERFRFRVNARGGVVDGQQAIQVTMRTIVTTPPKLDDIGLEPALLKGIYPRDGFVAVVGETGSGKSTLLSAVVRKMLEEPDGHRSIATAEAPIEYVYDEVEKPTSIIFQSEIGPSANLQTFSQAIYTFMRAKPDAILIGETRDQETCKGIMEAARTGHPGYTTLHANGVVATMRRLVGFYPEEAQRLALLDVIETLRMVVFQKLYRRRDGKGRFAIREFLQFDDGVRSELLRYLSKSQEEMLIALGKLVESAGQPLRVAAKRYYDEGLMFENDYLAITVREGA
jgi:defect in organelle trafficking protein DotB